MTQPALLAPVQPPTHPLVDLRCCSCEDVDWPEADLVIADPPWTYTGGHSAPAATDPSDHYRVLPTSVIARHVRAVARQAPLLALWVTWPLLAEWWSAWEASAPEDWGAAGRKGPVTGLAWVKSGADNGGHYGSGYWAAGCSEPVLLYSWGGGHTDRAVPLRGAHVEPPGEHSRKPARWMAQWIRRWVPEGGLVLDPYAGLGGVAEAVILAGGGRRYLGTEISPERYAAALSLLAQVRP